MNNQSPSTSTKSAPESSSASNQGKTQVFILTPDILKKLGIASKIPNLPTTNPVENAPSSNSTAPAKMLDVKLGEKMKNKLATVLNKKLNYLNVNKNISEAKQCDNDKNKTKQNDNVEHSVKSKLLSMLTSKKENEKVKSTSHSIETKIDEQTNVENQIKPMEDITSNLKDARSLQNSNTEILKHEIENRNKKKLEINTKFNTIFKVDESIENINSNKIIQLNEENKKEITDTEPPVQTTSLLKYMLSRETKINVLKTENEDIDKKNKVISIVKEDNKNRTTDAKEIIIHDKIEPKIIKLKQDEIYITHTKKATPKPRGRKRKIIEESPAEDPELISPIRKSDRKRKLSTLHSDYVTELKLHDGLNKKLPTRDRKSTERKSSEDSNLNLKRYAKNLSESNNLQLENSKPNYSENVERNIKTKIIASTRKSVDKIISKNENFESISDKNIQPRNLEFNTKSQNSVSKKSETLQILNRNKIPNNATQQIIHITECAESNKAEENINTEKSNKELENEVTMQQQMESSDKNASDPPSNKNFVNKNEAHSCKNRNVTEFNRQIDANSQLAPKKQIIIHQNILIKSPTKENFENFSGVINESINQENSTRPLAKKMLVNISEDSSEINTNMQTFIEQKRAGDSDTNSFANISLEVKPPLTASDETILRLSSDENPINKENASVTTISAPELNKKIEISVTEMCTLAQNNLDPTQNKETGNPNDTVINSAAEYLNSSTLENETEIKSPQNIILARRQLSQSGNDNMANTSEILSSSSLAKPDTSNLPFVVPIQTTQSSEEINTKLEILSESESTTPLKTPIQSRGRHLKELKNIQEQEILDSPIISTEKNSESIEATNEFRKFSIVSATSHELLVAAKMQTTISKEVINTKKEILTDNESTLVKNPMREKLQKQLKNIQEQEILDLPIISTEKNSESIEAINESRKLSIVSATSDELLVTAIIQTSSSEELINTKKEISTDSESTPVKSPIRKKVQPQIQLQNIQEQEISDSPIIYTEKNSESIEAKNESQEVIIVSATSDELLVTAQVQTTQNREEIYTKKEVLSDCESTSVKTSIRRKEQLQKQFKNIQEQEISDLPIISTEENSECIEVKNESGEVLIIAATSDELHVTTQNREEIYTKKEVLSDCESTSVKTPIRRKEQLQKQFKNIQEQEISDLPIISTEENSECIEVKNESGEVLIIAATSDEQLVTTQNREEIYTKKEVLSDCESTPVKTPIRRKEQLQKQFKNIQEQEISDLPIISTEENSECIEVKNESGEVLIIAATSDELLVTTQNREEIYTKKEVLSDCESTPVKTPIRRKEQLQKQFKNIQEQEISDLPIISTEENSECIEVKNESGEVLIIAATSDELLVTAQAQTTQNNEEINNKIELLADSESTPVKIPMRRRGRPSKQLKNIQEQEIYSPTVTTETNCKSIGTINENRKILISKTSNEPLITAQIQTTLSSREINSKQEVLTNSESTSPVKTPMRKKGRPRKQLKNIQELDIPREIPNLPTITAEPNPNESIGEIIESEELLIVSKTVKRRRLSPEEIISIENSDSSLEITPMVKRRPGRPGKRKTEIIDAEESRENEEKPDKEKSGEKEEIIDKESLQFIKIPGRGRRKKKKITRTGEVKTPSQSKVTCAVCKEVLDKSLWFNHAVKHNYLCWKVGEPAVDVNDRKQVEYILFKAIKNNPKFKHFVCQFCNDTRKSVMGFLDHQDMCQLTEEEREAKMPTCTICKKKILPQCMRYHMKSHEDKLLKKTIKIEVPDENKDLNESRGKRRAATKAEDLIQKVTKHENVPSSILNQGISGRKCYKQAKDHCSVFMNNGVIRKIQYEFNMGFKKCRFPNCEFKSVDFSEMKIHLNSCPMLNSNDYICKFCLFLDRDENNMKEHFKKNHTQFEKEYKDCIDDDLSESESDENDRIFSDDGSTTSKPRTRKIENPTKPSYKVNFLVKEKRIVSDSVGPYLPAIRWTYEFRQEYYAKQIFNNIKCFDSKCLLIPLNEQSQYVPLLKKSMSVKSYLIAQTIPNYQQKVHEWKEYSLYESTLDKDTLTTFCGGPIWAMAWVPTPMDLICDQYLAVSLQKDFETTYKINESPTGKEVIQFWNFGPLESKKRLESEPNLEFSIAHNHGMVWCMEWAPSGFYDHEDPSDPNELRKLGLLALACSDGTIPIYAIGIPRNIENSENNIYTIKPVFKLILQEPTEHLLGRWKYQATKVSWSKSSGHNIIAGGFSNGIVCLWDIENSSPLLRSEVAGVTILKPYHSFQAHTSAVSALILYPLIDAGQRWLLTGSWDRTFKYWDTNNTSAPISTFGKRGVITDGVWISHWLCSFFSFDDVYSLGHTVTTVQNPRDFSFRQSSALASNSVVMSVSANDWASAVMQGNLAGELTSGFPRQILMSYDVDKHLKCKRMMLSYNEIIDKTKHISKRTDKMKSEKKEKLDNEKGDKLFAKFLINNENTETYVEEPTTYEGARQKYGMLFCDFNLDKFSCLPKDSLEMVRQSNRLREVPTELYPFTSLNRVVWNPNKQAYLYAACGYQNGFVRLRCVRFMNTGVKQ